MARRSRMSIVKRQRELKKAEKAARKRARRHGIVEEGFTEPVPTGRAALGLAPEPDAEPAGEPPRDGDQDDAEKPDRE